MKSHMRICTLQFSFFLLLVLLNGSSTVIAQTISLPGIRPTAYQLKIENVFPYSIDPNRTISHYGKRKNYKFTYPFGDVWENDFNQNTNSTLTYYITDMQMPSKLHVNFQVDSMHQYSEVDWSNCQIDPYDQGWSSDNCPQITYTDFDETYHTLLADIPLTFPYMDTIVYGTRYGSAVRITINTATDNNYTLPSHHKIAIKADYNPHWEAKWEYQVLDTNGNGVWQDIPHFMLPLGLIELHVSGEALFGSNWMNNLNKTILFRLSRPTVNGVITSNVVVYTHRLSAPKINSLAVSPNPCFGMDSASVSIQLNRQLIANETINLFLKDSITGADFSALNLTSADIGNNNTYSWKKELIRGVYRLSIIGKYLNHATYTGSPDHFRKVVITDPELLRLHSKQEPAICFGGNSGAVLVRAKGGVGGYKFAITDSLFNNSWTPFSSPTLSSDGYYEHRAANLTSGSYKIKLRDANDCMIRDSLGTEIVRRQNVTQPVQPLSVPNYVVNPVTSNNAANGSILIGLNGGSPFFPPEVPTNFKKYDFEWRDSTTNTVISNYSLDTTGKFETKIQNLSAGTYRFTAWDRNYDQQPSSNQQGCKVDIFIKLQNPDRLRVSIAMKKPISCPGGSDGQLVAVATGGIPVSDSLRYRFQWYMLIQERIRETGVITIDEPSKDLATRVTVGVNDSILYNVSAGIYYVVIYDKYNNTVSARAFQFVAPERFNTSVSTTSSSCYFTADGSMSVNVSGGTPPYRYEWSNGALTQSVQNVAGGTYFVVVKDTNMCLVTQQVNVSSPNRILTTVTTQPVTCFNSASGGFSMETTGGTGNFSYLWSNGSTASSISNLQPGSYWYRVNDANGCFDTDTLQLANAQPFSIDAGPDRKICINQNIPLIPSVSGATPGLNIKWITPNGIKDSFSIRTSSPGTYILQAQNTTGCIVFDTLNITTENASVNTNFTVSSQAFVGENTTLVNISQQLQDSVKWILPSSMSYQLIRSNKNYCELKIADTGVFNVGMKAYYSNGCIDEVYKNVNVLRSMTPGNLGSQAEAFLKQFTVVPNPTTGMFTVNMLFNSITQARLRIVNILTNVSIDTRLLNGSASYSEQYNISSQPAGTYIIVIETAKGNFIHKLNKI